MIIRIKIGNVWGGVALLVLASCADHWDDFTPKHEEEAEGISFTATVSSSRMVQDTRADGSIVNLNEYTLPETKMRDYWRANEEGTVEKTSKEFYVGVFGCYTGQNTWESLATLSEKASPTDEETATLQDHYSANLLYNQKAKILEPSSRGTNALEYTPLRFWPNNLLESDATQHEYCTFWAYYPYNETADPGAYGISISAASQGKGKGMGSMKFTMHPDAAQQSDFMISDIVTDCNRDAYPLVGTAVNTYSPKPVPFVFHHLLAQVRLYAFIRGTDKIVYAVDNAADDKIRRVTAEEAADETKQIVDAWGVAHDAVEGEPIPDDTEWLDSNEKKGETVRWSRTTITDVDGTLMADITYSMSFNNIKTECTFTPEYDASGNATFNYTNAETLGSATVNHYIMNPYWFTFQDNERVMLNDQYMYGFFENVNDDNKNGSFGEGDNTLGYQRTEETQNPDNNTKHYNYFPGNIIMAVPQVLKDEDVPHIVITAKGKDTNKNDVSARVTINMLNMQLKWESGFIYCYAFLDELMPGDDKVKGPESITVVFDPRSWTDQW